jgi:succinate dehydrogenase/fumarate reductase cytochrome b subunit
MFAHEALAQSSGQFSPSYLTNFVEKATALLNSLIPLLFGVAVVIFFWGLVKFVWNSGSEDAKAEGKRLMIWGIIALVVMVSIYGIIAILQTTFGIQGGQMPTFPTIGGRS